MSIPEAAQLVLAAGTMGTGGETFILEMGKPVRIAELAQVALTYDPGRIRRKLMEIVPDYKPAEVHEPVYRVTESKRHVPEKQLRHSGEVVTAPLLF